MDTVDLEKDHSRMMPLTDSPSLATFITSDKDKSPSIYKRFERLSARNILHLQSESMELEAQQDEYDTQVASLGLEAKKSLRDWTVLKEQASQSTALGVRGLSLAREIREKLKDHKDVLIQESYLLAMPNPSRRSYDALFRVFHHTERGEQKDWYPVLGGQSKHILDDRKDLVALSQPTESDRLTAFFRHRLSFLFELRKASPSQDVVYISEKRIHLVVGAINTLLAAALLFGAIYNLYYVTDPNIKLGLIAGYTTAFALCLALFTNAKRSEIFGACAAYAAVLVVFVSGVLRSN